MKGVRMRTGCPATSLKQINPCMTEKKPIISANDNGNWETLYVHVLLCFAYQNDYEGTCFLFLVCLIYDKGKKTCAALNLLLLRH